MKPGRAVLHPALELVARSSNWLGHRPLKAGAAGSSVRATIFMCVSDGYGRWVRSPSATISCAVSVRIPQKALRFVPPFTTIRWILQYARARSTPTPIFYHYPMDIPDTRLAPAPFRSSRGCSGLPGSFRPSIRYPVDRFDPQPDDYLSASTHWGRHFRFRQGAFSSLHIPGNCCARHGCLLGRRVWLPPKATPPRNLDAEYVVSWLMRGPGRLLMRRPMVFLRATHAFARILGFCRMRCSRNGNTDL